MPLSITCACGARLEIDDRFAGQSVPCPDCHASLHVPAAAPPSYPRVSGLAVASLMVSLIGAFTLVGGLAGALLGYFARRRIETQPTQLTDLRLARAAMVTGVGGTALALVALASPDVFHLGALLREFQWARKLDYSPASASPPQVEKAVGVDSKVSLLLPSARWGDLASNRNSQEPSDLFILMDLVDDAQIACRSLDLAGDDAGADAMRGKGLEQFAKSELVSLLARVRSDPLAKTPAPRDAKQIDEGTQEMRLDLRLAGVRRSFLLRVTKKGPRAFLLIGAARASDFARLEPQLRQALDSFRLVQ